MVREVVAIKETTTGTVVTEETPTTTIAEVVALCVTVVMVRAEVGIRATTIVNLAVIRGGTLTLELSNTTIALMIQDD
jgi:hypothetical protein